MQITIDISDEQIRNLLGNAFEGGVGYWCKIDHYEGGPHQKVMSYGSHECVWPHYCYLPLEANGKIICIDCTGEKGSPPEPWVLDREAIERGLKLLLTNRTAKGETINPIHSASFIGDETDSETGDVFLQLCLFGDKIKKG